MMLFKVGLPPKRQLAAGSNDDDSFVRLPDGQSAVSSAPEAYYGWTNLREHCENACRESAACKGYTYVDNALIHPSQRCYTTTTTTTATIADTKATTPSVYFRSGVKKDVRAQQQQQRGGWG